jgi:SAM-dependent methyltransferase
MDTDWYRHFFHGVALDFWREAVSPEQTLSEVAFLEQCLAGSSAARLLDVPCGNGRHTLALSQRGHRLSAVDLAEEFIREAKDRASGAGLDVEFRLGDMRQLAWESEFDGVFCFGNSFGYLDHSGTRAFLAAVARALKPGGRFVLESGAVAEALLPSLKTRSWYQAGDIHLLIANRYDALAGRLDTEYTFIAAGKLETRSGSQQVYRVAEIRRLLAEVGLEVRALYQSTDRKPFELGSPRLILVAQKEAAAGGP